MKLRADTMNPSNVPKVGDKFEVISVEKSELWWNIKLERL